MLRRVVGVTLVAAVALAPAAPALAAPPHGGAFRGGFHAGRGIHHTGFRGGGGGLRGGFRGGFHHHHGFHRFGCCIGPVVVSSVLVGGAVAAADYEDAYPPPAYAEAPYAPAPTYQPPAPSAPPVVCYVGGCYHLHGNGVNVPYQWVWVPAAPALPPPPPAAPNG